MFLFQEEILENEFVSVPELRNIGSYFLKQTETGITEDIFSRL